MESTGAKNKIHLSAETAELIRAAKYKDIWTSPRKEQIEAKGKGKLNTFWLAYTNQGGRSVSSSGTNVTSGEISGSFSVGGDASIGSAEDMETTEMLADSQQKKLDRSIEWGVDILQRLLKRVVAMRGGIEKSLSSRRNRPMPSLPASTSPLEEVIDIIELPSQEHEYPVNPSEIELPPQVIFQLRDFVRSIASMYHDNPFHSFDHATHVTQSVTKLLTRVVTPNDGGLDAGGHKAKLHQYTYGLTSDPLAQFSVALSALIHDVDHPGVPNATLVQEQSQDAITYKNKSVAEQNSVDVAWELLSQPSYAKLRACIFTLQYDQFP